MAKYVIVIEDVNADEATVQLQCVSGKNENTQASNIAATAMDVIKELVIRDDEAELIEDLPRQKVNSDIH